MKLSIFAVYDTKAEAYLPPWFSHNRAVAVRNFTTAAHDEDHQFHKHASDFALFELGTFDDSSAEFVLLPAPLSLGLAQNYLTPKATPLTLAEGNKS